MISSRNNLQQILDEYIPVCDARGSMGFEGFLDDGSDAGAH